MSDLPLIALGLISLQIAQSDQMGPLEVDL